MLAGRGYTEGDDVLAGGFGVDRVMGEFLADAEALCSRVAILAGVAAALWRFTNIAGISQEALDSTPLRHVLTSVVGTKDDLKPESREEQLQRGDRLLLHTQCLRQLILPAGA